MDIWDLLISLILSMRCAIQDVTPTPSPSSAEQALSEVPTVSVSQSSEPPVFLLTTPTVFPSTTPIDASTKSPIPSAVPSTVPSKSPSDAPSLSPAPSLAPSSLPSKSPSDAPSLSPVPSSAPSKSPLPSLTLVPSSVPSKSPMPTTPPLHFRSSSVDIFNGFFSDPQQIGGGFAIDLAGRHAETTVRAMKGGESFLVEANVETFGVGVCLDTCFIIGLGIERNSLCVGFYGNTKFFHGWDSDNRMTEVEMPNKTINAGRDGLTYNEGGKCVVNILDPEQTCHALPPNWGNNPYQVRAFAVIWKEDDDLNIQPKLKISGSSVEWRDYDPENADATFDYETINFDGCTN